MCFRTIIHDFIGIPTALFPPPSYDIGSRVRSHIVLGAVIDFIFLSCLCRALRSTSGIGIRILEVVCTVCQTDKFKVGMVLAEHDIMLVREAYRHVQKISMSYHVVKCGANSWCNVYIDETNFWILLQAMVLELFAHDQLTLTFFGARLTGTAVSEGMLTLRIILSGQRIAQEQGRVWNVLKFLESVKDPQASAVWEYFL